MISDEQLRRVKSEAQEALFRIPGVRAVAIGHKFVGGENTRQVAIIVKVEKKRSLSDIPANERIPTQIEGIPTDVAEWQPEIFCGATRDDSSKERPLLGGTKIQMDMDTEIHEGTLGFIGRTTGTVAGIPQGGIVGVTCNHVVTNTATPGGITQLRRKVGQDSTLDCSRCCQSCYDIIGKVLHGVGILIAAPNIGHTVDAALIALDQGLKYYRDIIEVGAVAGPRIVSSSDIGLKVRKRGFRTGLTFGTVQNVSVTTVLNGQTMSDSDIDILPDPATPIWDDCVGTNDCVGHRNFSSFGCVGDSGAAVLDLQNHIIGLFRSIHCDGTGVATGIDVVTTALGIVVLTAQTPQETQGVPDVTGINAMVGATDEVVSEVLMPRFQQELERVRQEVRATPLGRRYEEVVKRHEREVLDLVNTNRRVGAVWQRNGGSQLVQGLLRMLQFRDQRLPSEINERPLPECLRKIQEILMRYGSAALAADLSEYGPRLIQSTGLTYAQMLASLQEMSSE
jgi:hypothetical protein